MICVIQIRNEINHNETLGEKKLRPFSYIFRNMFPKWLLAFLIFKMALLFRKFFLIYDEYFQRFTLRYILYHNAINTTVEVYVIITQLKGCRRVINYHARRRKRWKGKKNNRRVVLQRKNNEFVSDKEKDTRETL